MTQATTPAVTRQGPAPLAGAGVGPWLVVAGATATVVAGLVIHTSKGGLGASLPPFFMRWAPAVDPFVAVSVIVLGAGIVAAMLLADRVGRPAAFCAGLFLLALALGLAVNLARVGTHGWYAVFDTGPHGLHEAHNEYLPALGALTHGAGHFVRHFAELAPWLPVHVRGNPPGLVLTLHFLGIHTAAGMTALCTGVGALTAPLAYYLGRTLGGEQRGRTAGLLTAFAPAMLLLGVTSADYAYAALGLGAACLLARRQPQARIAGAVLAGIAAFFSWLLLAIPAWAVLVSWRRDGLRAAVALASLCALALALVDLVLFAAVGYDPFAALHATILAYHHGISSTRPYAFWVAGSPAAWGAMLGPPIFWLALKSVRARDPAAVALAATIATAAILGFTKAETERIWLPFVPLACVAAAGAMPRRLLMPVLTALAAQALIVELLFDTVW